MASEESRLASDIGPVSFPDNTILTLEDLSRWLQLSPRTVQDLPIPRLRYPTTVRRYLARQVLDFLEGRTE